MGSKALVRFLNRAARFDGDVEFADVIAAAARDGALSTDKSKLFDHVDKKKHPRLAAQTVNAGNRRTVVYHLKSTVHAAYIKEIYEDMSAYFADVLRAAAANGLDPGRLVGEHKFSVDANEILKCGSWDAIVAMVTRDLFRKLENEKSTKALLEKIDAKLDLKADAKIIQTALPYLEIRHLLVHQDGKVDDAFVKAHPGFGVKSGDYIDLTHELVSNTRTAVVALVRHFDEKIVKAKLLGKADLQ